jgi:hypothetical protein
MAAYNQATIDRPAINFSGWTQGAMIVLSDDGTLPAEPADGYHVTVTFSATAGPAVYTAQRNVRVSQQENTTTLKTFYMGAGHRATGASSCSAAIN